MGRHKRTGLTYFPLDCGFFKDRTIRRLISRFGSDGALFYLYILSAAYENGYYVKGDEEFLEDAALDLQCGEEKIGLMLDYLLNKTLLDRTLFDTVKVLSSHGIQTQYQEVMKDLKRDIEVDEDFWILDNSETLGFIKVRPNENKSGKNEDKSRIYTDKSGENALNKRKEKEKKNKEEEKEKSPAADAALGKVMTSYMKFIQAIPPSFVTEALKGYTADLGAEVVCYAIEKAAANNVFTWDYVNGILRSYTQKGVRTMEAAQRDEAEHQRKKSVLKPDQKAAPAPARSDVSREDLDRMREMVARMKGGAQ